MPDEIIEELWSVKDSIAREHDYDLSKLAAYLRGLNQWGHPSKSRRHSIYRIVPDGPVQRLAKTA